MPITSLICCLSISYLYRGYFLLGDRAVLAGSGLFIGNVVKSGIFIHSRIGSVKWRGIGDGLRAEDRKLSL